MAFVAGCLPFLDGLAHGTPGVASSTVAAAEDLRPESKPRATSEERERDAAELEAAEPEILARIERIREELTEIEQRDPSETGWPREWAGTYYDGDGLGWNATLMVSPGEGIAYTHYGCLGLYDGNYGEVIDAFDLDGDGSADGLTVEWALHRRDGFGFDANIFHFVRWLGPDGDTARRYLVPESKLLEMANNFNQGGYSRDGMHGIPRKQDGAPRPTLGNPDKAVAGAPELPSKWAKLLHAERVDATVTRVSPAEVHAATDEVVATRARVGLDKGRADGLYLGLEIRIRNRNGRGTLTINSIEERSAEGEFEAFTLSEKVALPQVGERVRVFEGVEPCLARTDPAAKSTAARASKVSSPARSKLEGALAANAEAFFRGEGNYTEDAMGEWLLRMEGREAGDLGVVESIGPAAYLQAALLGYKEHGPAIYLYLGSKDGYRDRVVFVAIAYTDNIGATARAGFPAVMSIDSNEIPNVPGPDTIRPVRSKDELGAFLERRRGRPLTIGVLSGTADDERPSELESLQGAMGDAYPLFRDRIAKQDPPARQLGNFLLGSIASMMNACPKEYRGIVFRSADALRFDVENFSPDRVPQAVGFVAKAD